MSPEERAFIEKVRSLYADASTDVRERIVGSDHFLEGRIIPEHPHTPIALFDIGADYRDIAFYVNAHRAVGILLRARDQAIAYYRSQNPEPAPGPDKGGQGAAEPFSFARNCAIHCGNPLFQKFMFEVHGLEHAADKIRMATRIHSLLAISSRTELDTDEAARDRWLSLRSEYKAWKDMRL